MHPTYYIVPSTILRRIAEKGNDQQREMALITLEETYRIGGRRDILGLQSRIPYSRVGDKKRRAVFDAHNVRPGTTLVRQEGEPPTGDAAVDEAYDYSGFTYDFYKDVFGRNSIDDNGMRLDSLVHCYYNFSNAMWNGRQLICGDGDGQTFNRFTKSIDVVAHELTHGVTEYEVGFEIYNQPGALNEHFCDVFGSLVKQYLLKQTVIEADWLIGEHIFNQNINANALWSMKEPGTAYNDALIGVDAQPAHMRDYKEVDYDNGGVHINSGIPNKAFYLTAMEIGGFAWKEAGKIWYITLRNRLKANSNFQEAANSTFNVAGELFGNGSDEQKAVRRGWEHVGLSS